MYKVLFVDDEPWAVIDIMHSISWEEQGFHVLGHYEKPREAVAAILEQQPDLVFTDIRMPVWDGFEVIRRCREGGSDAEFIILSGYSDFELAKRAIRAAVLDYCLKPVNPAALVKLLEEIKPILADKRILRQEGLGETAEFTPGEEEKNDQFQNILTYIQENYASKLVLTQLASQFNFNKNYICYLFKKHAGTTFTAYVTHIRIEEAKKMLRTTRMTQSDIAAATGFMDYYYFNKVFKTECGLTPYQYRRREQAEKGEQT